MTINLPGQGFLIWGPVPCHPISVSNDCVFKHITLLYQMRDERVAMPVKMSVPLQIFCAKGFFHLISRGFNINAVLTNIA